MAKRSREVSPEAAAGPAVVELRTGGALLLEGKPVSLAGLHRACAGKDTIALKIEDAAPWAHVEWILAALEAAGVRLVRFDLRDGGADACFRSHEEPAIEVNLAPNGDLSDVAVRLGTKPAARVVVLHVAPEVTHERLVAAVNEIARAGFKKVDFAGLEPPDLATRRLSALPR